MFISLTILSILSLTCGDLEISKVPSHPCDRKCSRFNAHKTCHFKFKIESKMTGPLGCTNCVPTDGYETISKVVNSRLPGPPISVCYQDTIIVDVTNELSEPTDIHWHGIHQVETPWMDGTQFVTQYPIQPSETIRYRFAANMPGTFFYHSHYANQRSLGVGGSLVIRRTKDLVDNLYDVDANVLFLNDWFYDGDIYKANNVLTL